MRCELCGSPSETDTCEGCLFIQNNPAVIRDDEDFHFWLWVDEEIEWDSKPDPISVEIEAMELALDRTFSRREAENLRKEICKLNKKLRRLN